MARPGEARGLAFAIEDKQSPGEEGRRGTDQVGFNQKIEENSHA
jgi:hypothetical protein